MYVCVHCIYVYVCAVPTEAEEGGQCELQFVCRLRVPGTNPGFSATTMTLTATLSPALICVFLFSFFCFVFFLSFLPFFLLNNFFVFMDNLIFQEPERILWL